MSEFLLYTDSDYNQGKFKGSKVENDYLKNKIVEINNDSFNNKYYTDWQENDSNEYITTITSNADSQTRLRVKKDNNEMIDYAEFGNIRTDFYSSGMAPNEIEYLSINFNSNIQDAGLEQKIVLTIFGSEDTAYQEIHFSSRGNIEIRNYYEGSGYNTQYIETSADDSVTPISNQITNNINNANLDFAIDNESQNIYTRLRVNGSKSIWYQNDFGDNLISGIEISGKAQKDHRIQTKYSFETNKINIYGYDTDLIYSNIYDTGENNSVTDSFDYNINLSSNSIMPRNFSTTLLVILKSGNDINDWSHEEEINITLNPGANQRSLDLNLEGRYIKIEVISYTRYNEFSIDYLLVNYQLASEFEKIDKQIDYHVIESVDFSEENIVEGYPKNFNFKIYIPPDAGGEEDVAVIRHAEGEKFAEGVFGFEFDPFPETDKYILIEVDYGGYQTNPYMSEDGLLIGYLDINGQPKTVETKTFKENKKLIGYLL